ncbi:MAG: hypothetical protein SH857_07070 [Chitinophagales bacterium]|nr:hypothetical protein [Chitinophagales bacterium]
MIRLFIFILLSFPSLLLAQTSLLLNGHAHNDYLHKCPLLDALEHGFFSVEVDIYYENGSFIVAHIKTGIRKKNTLERLYLEPLRERVIASDGKVYAHGSLEFELMLDLKGGWSGAQIDSLERLVMRYEKNFTVYEDGIKSPRAVKIVLSGGNGNFNALNHNPRYFSIDGGLGDFNSPLDSTIICRTSASFKSHFKWRGIGEMPDEERIQLREYVAHAHATGRKIRFWAATNRERVWKELLDAGVDWVNVDKLEKFRKFYVSY